MAFTAGFYDTGTTSIPASIQSHITHDVLGHQYPYHCYTRANTSSVNNFDNHVFPNTGKL